MHLHCTVSGLQLPNPCLESFSNQTAMGEPSFTHFPSKLHLRCCSKIQRRKFGSWSGLGSDRQPDLKVLKKERSYFPGRENVAHGRGWFLQLW